MDRVLESNVGDPQRAPAIRATPDRRGRVKMAAVWLIPIAAAIAGVWRMATFTPQPLDSPSTLRPVLYALFSRFVQHYGGPEPAFSAWYGICAIALLVAPVLAVLNYLRCAERSWGSRIPGWLCSRALLFTSIGVCLLLCRFPVLLQPELNPDEGQFLASADKLFWDANFFRANDCGTSGPVNVYPLMLPGAFGITPDFASSRIIALGTLFLSVCLLYATIRLIAADEIARLAILPVAGMFAAFKNVGLTEYSSEDVPVLLISIALYSAVRILRRPIGYRFPLFLIGFVSSAAFLAKLQAVPIMATLALIALAYVYVTRSAATLWSPVLFFLGGLAPLQVWNAATSLATGVWHDFWMSYIVTNLYYADARARFVSDMPRLLAYLDAYDDVRVFLFTFLGLSAAYLFLRLRRSLATTSVAFLGSAIAGAAAISVALFFYVSNFSGITSYIALIAIVTAPVFILLRWRETPLGRDPSRWFGLLVLLFTLSSAFSVYQAHRPFPHYLLFLFIPISSVIAWMLIRQTAPDSTSPYRQPMALAFVAVLAVFVVAGQAYLWGTQDDRLFANIPKTIRAPEGDYIRAATSPGGQIVVWGWTVAPYLASGRVPATRDTNMANFFRWPAITAYYRKRFLQEMRNNPPEMFIDAVGPASFAFTDPAVYGMQHFPEIESFVSSFYVVVGERFGERFYLRRDLAAHRAGSPPSP